MSPPGIPATPSCLRTDVSLHSMPGTSLQSSKMQSSPPQHLKGFQPPKLRTPFEGNPSTSTISSVPSTALDLQRRMWVALETQKSASKQLNQPESSRPPPTGQWLDIPHASYSASSFLIDEMRQWNMENTLLVFSPPKLPMLTLISSCMTNPSETLFRRGYNISSQTLDPSNRSTLPSYQLMVSTTTVPVVPLCKRQTSQDLLQPLAITSMLENVSTPVKCACINMSVPSASNMAISKELAQWKKDLTHGLQPKYL
jgi:hypothetical protein